MPPPNIIFAFTDQQSSLAAGYIKPFKFDTPHIDRLAANGTSFHRAYCAQPICVPSRTAMFTGLLPHQSGIDLNVKGEVPGFRPSTLPMLLAKAGYSCAHFGRWHMPFCPENREAHGFHEVVSCADDAIAQSCASFLDARSGDARPLFLVLSYTNPHDICQWARGEKLPMGDLEAPPPPEACPPLPSNFEVPDAEPSAIRAFQQWWAESFATLDWPPDRWRQYRWAYAQLVQRADRALGDCLAALETRGILDGALIAFSSDHGDGMGAHRWNKKQLLYEEQIRVPFILQGESLGIPKGHTSDALVNVGIDLMPTLCDFAGIRPPSGLAGENLKRLALGHPGALERDAVIVETTLSKGDTPFGPKGRALIGRRYKYAVYSMSENPEQLFDVRSDPGETLNLARHPSYAKVLQRHRSLLAAMLQATGDPFT